MSFIIKKREIVFLWDLTLMLSVLSDTRINYDMPYPIPYGMGNN